MRFKKYAVKKWSKIREGHPSTISAMNNLANTLRDQGQLEGAAAMKKEVLEKRRCILGKEHPKIILATKSLAILTSMRDA